ncbi:glutathione S-transferase family protein [Rhizobium sp. C1]|uniref:glutathione S-transferase family protein n=1 Tax=Rhizobium sp. C1 TaxID=1349799 RepID=UPI001E65B6AA|nr:glutathione S-transferase family protein [Rhizobium sp. C1]MCD2177229.1 glutathione S-transferase family protein [Rhizobium sp. C1]
MTSTDRVTLHYMPQTRAAGTRIILEELGAPYDLHVMNMKAGENREPGYLSINPLGKVPAIEHRGKLVTEQIAIAIYLGDLFPQAGLTPAVDVPDRGPYLRWLVYYAACFEPALMDKFRNVDPGPITQSVYGSYDLMLDTLEGALSNGPYILGDRLSLADIQWGVALRWTMMFGIVPERPRFVEYRDSLIARPAFAKVWNEDAVLAEQHAAEARA